MDRRIYLASPYSSRNEQLRVARYNAVCAVAAELLREGLLVFSPIAHSHPLAAYALPIEFDFWQRYCLSFLRYWATELYVLTLEGWNTSQGVRAEIRTSRRLGLLVYLRDMAGIVEPYHV